MFSLLGTRSHGLAFLREKELRYEIDPPLLQNLVANCNSSQLLKNETVVEHMLLLLRVRSDESHSLLIEALYDNHAFLFLLQ